MIYINKSITKSKLAMFYRNKMSETGMRKIGYLAVYLGPMGSGKSTRALEQATQFSTLGLKTAYITSTMDTERKLTGGVEGKFSSHNPLNSCLDKSVEYMSCSAIKDLNLECYDAIVIDESQFLESLKDDVYSLVSKGKIVQVYGLSGDYTGNKFGEAIDLIPMADEFHQMKAKCTQCFSNRDNMHGFFSSAPFTDRIITGSKVVVVGGMTMYKPCCRAHHTHI